MFNTFIDLKDAIFEESWDNESGHIKEMFYSISGEKIEHILKHNKDVYTRYEEIVQEEGYETDYSPLLELQFECQIGESFEDSGNVMLGIGVEDIESGTIYDVIDLIPELNYDMKQAAELWNAHL